MRLLRRLVSDRPRRRPRSSPRCSSSRPRPDSKMPATSWTSSWDAAAPRSTRGSGPRHGQQQRCRDARAGGADRRTKSSDMLRGVAGGPRGREAAIDAIDVANELEGMGRRLVRRREARPPVGRSDVTGPIDAYAQAPRARPSSPRFADAARAYAEERKGRVDGLVADVFGYDAVPTIAVPHLGVAVSRRSLWSSAWTSAASSSALRRRGGGRCRLRSAAPRRFAMLAAQPAMSTTARARRRSRSSCGGSADEQRRLAEALVDAPARGEHGPSRPRARAVRPPSSTARRR